MPLPTNFSSSPRRQLIRFVLIILGCICIVFGFIRGMDTPPTRTLWVIDNSLSMAVTDVSGGSGILISRLDLAKQIVASGAAMRSGEQAIMIAAGGARLEMPMTDDRRVFSDVVRGITIQTQGGGSSISTPLEIIRLIYGSIRSLEIVWITDGEFSDSGSTLSGWTMTPSISLIGVGTRSCWPILLGYGDSGLPRYKESDGKRVVSTRDDVTLRWVADTLDAELILAESYLDGAIWDIAKRSNPNMIPPYMTIIWVLLTISGLMISRFHYNTKTWN